MNRDQRIAVEFDRLFRTYPSSGQGSTPEDVTRDRMERARVYFDAVLPYEVRDIEAAVQSFLTGSAPGHNPAFAPSAPQVAGEVRRLMNLRLDSERRAQTMRPALPPPDIVHSPESQARVKAAAANLINNLASLSRTDDAEAAKAKSAQWAKTNARFNPDMDEAEIARRLRFTAGDPEGDEAAA